MSWYDERKRRMEAQADAGESEQEIADYWGVSPQQVHRILSGYYEKAAEALREVQG